MKSKIMITISDIDGSRQYNLYQLIHHFALWIFVIFVVNIAIGALLVSTLTSAENEVSVASVNTIQSSR
jgi:ABC-type multidrug transport system permease subunit